MPESKATVGGETGERCPESGPYRSSGPTGAIVFIKEGDRFPRDVDGSTTEWTLLSDGEGSAD